MRTCAGERRAYNPLLRTQDNRDSRVALLLVPQDRLATVSATERKHVRQRTPPSYCATCDEEHCEHGGARYHPSWFDLRVDGQLAPEYQAWFDANPWGGEEREAPKARSLDALRSDLNVWIYLDPQLDSLLEREYERNDRRVSMLVQDIVRSCEQGRLMRPSGTLASRLKALTR